ncbi:hypothetical protein P691DRAFT_805360 [Macrolepiota fuliginosa MF-IS2]|uniref:Uncharacterized protein n=1 Tax=Macrolepiota fuliginosa MF-IS2 TaxID=1400762 RepID=A0A9P6C7R2_9AGAR|nr:hypothetical protein P691DRAFT_805360 [Macrolepiota fuliginosa MF-IS2]
MFRKALLIRSTVARGRSYSSKPKTDEYGIPFEPTWSVAGLLSSYQKPSISSRILIRLHELAALESPQEGTPQFESLKGEMSELVRLVEAVKLVDTQGIVVAARWDTEDADKRNAELAPHVIPEGQELLRHASRTQDGFYLVDADRKRKPS